jgi:hypothetical protein
MLATWDGLYSALGLPEADPAIYAQAGGAFALGFGYALWLAPRATTLTRVVAATSALINVLLAALAVAWLADTHVSLPGHEALALGLAVPVLVTVAVVEAVIASRSVAILLPPD